MQLRHVIVLGIAGSLAACDTSGSAEADGAVAGEATYEDAQTEHDGEPSEPARPGPQPGNEPLLIDVEVSGTGELSGLDPSCLDGATGSFSGLFFSEAELRADGLYTATLASSEAQFWTPSGCAIPDLEISAFTEVVVKGMLTSKSRNCEGYCEAKARKHAEAECGAAPGAAACRAEAEASYAASCQASCESSETYAIVGRSRLGADALAALNAQSVTGRALGEVEINLTFDRLEDADGERVPEN
jgi:hypothetical protein